MLGGEVHNEAEVLAVTSAGFAVEPCSCMDGVRHQRGFRRVPGAGLHLFSPPRPGAHMWAALDMLADRAVRILAPTAVVATVASTVDRPAGGGHERAGVAGVSGRTRWV